MFRSPILERPNLELPDYLSNMGPRNAAKADITAANTATSAPTDIPSSTTSINAGTGSIIQQAIQAVAPSLSSKKQRMAGDLLSATTSSVPSMAGESATMKYSPTLTSKAPSSQYLSYGSGSGRLTGS